LDPAQLERDDSSGTGAALPVGAIVAGSAAILVLAAAAQFAGKRTPK